MSSKYQGKVFYGWWIVAAGFLIMGAAYGIVTNCVGLFVKPVTENMGFTRQAFSMNQTLVSFAMMAIPLLSGKIFGRFNVKTVMRLCTVTLVLAYVLWVFSGGGPVLRRGDIGAPVPFDQQLVPRAPGPCHRRGVYGQRGRWHGI